MHRSNPYSTPQPIDESPDLVIKRQWAPFLLGFFGAGLFPLMWTLAYVGTISFDGPLLIFGIGAWGFTFPICIACLYVLVKKPAPVIELVGDALKIRDLPFRSSGTTLSTSEIKYVAHEHIGEGEFLVVALLGADDTQKPIRHWFMPRRSGCILVNVRLSVLSTAEVAQKLSDQLGVPNQGLID